MYKLKKDEVDAVFKKLKIDDLSDMDRYSQLYQNVDKAIADMKIHYKDLQFSKIHMNRDSIRKIDKAILEIS